MKLVKPFLLCVCLIGLSNSTNAQFWKKLKKKLEKKVEQKVEEKIDKETDKVIDSTLNGKKKKVKKDNRLKSYGSASISHSALYGMFSVNDLGQTGVEKQGDKVSITGFWRTSDADVFDGYILKIKNVDDINALQNKTFKIPEEATLKLSYNALVKGKYEYRRGQVHAPQDIQVKSGTATVTFNKDQNVSVNFSANVKLSDYNKSELAENDTPATINGMITTTSPKYTITKEFKQIERKEQNNDLTEADKTYIKSKLSPTINIPSSFTFNKSIELEFTDNRGETFPMEFLLGKYPDIYGISVASKEMGAEGKVVMVMTPKSSTAFMDVAGMKMKRSSSLEQMGSQFNMTDKLPQDGDFDYKKTGNTKNILGYICHEYRVDYNYSNSKGNSIFWVSKDFPIQNKQLPMLGMKMNNPYFSGFVLELNSTHQGENYTIKVTKVSDKSMTINTSEYRKMGF
ncbi:hypothetical protein [Polaribacter porphyrae]|nr:hypothetical protein [Polaribacter porphyrae]